MSVAWNTRVWNAFPTVRNKLIASRVRAPSPFASSPALSSLYLICSERIPHSSRGKLRPCPVLSIYCLGTDTVAFTQRAAGWTAALANWSESVGFRGWCILNTLTFCLFCVLCTCPPAYTLLTAAHESTLVTKHLSIPYPGNTFLLGWERICVSAVVLSCLDTVPQLAFSRGNSEA